MIIVICTFIFSIIVLIPISLICLDNYYGKKSDEIYSVFSQWCNSSRYLLVQKGVHTLELGKKEIDLENDLKQPIVQKYKNVKNVSFMNSILYAGDFFYCCGIEEKNDSKYELAIYKVSFEQFLIQKVLTIEGYSNSSNYALESAFGYGDKGYFKVDNIFYEYDFANNKLNILDKNDERIHLCSFTNYSDYLNVTKMKCNSKSGFCYFYYENDEYSFNQEIIEADKLSLINKYMFKIEWCVSFDDGLTSFVYYSGSKLLGYGECLICTYNRFTEQIVDFQLVSHTYFDVKNTILLPKIVF